MITLDELLLLKIEAMVGNLRFGDNIEIEEASEEKQCTLVPSPFFGQQQSTFIFPDHPDQSTTKVQTEKKKKLDQKMKEFCLAKNLRRKKAGTEEEK